MKNKVLYLVLVFFMFFSLSLKSQLFFSVSPGLKFNSSHIGYKINNIVPYAGLSFAMLKGDYTYNGHTYDYENNTVNSYTDEMSGNLNIFMPAIGAKFFFLSKNKINAFANINFSTPFIKTKFEYDFGSPYTDDEEIDELYEDFQEGLDAFRFFSIETGVGAEYFFDNNFSIGAEAGFRYLDVKYDYTYEETLWGYSGDITVENSIFLKFKAIPSYSKVYLNFYF